MSDSENARSEGEARDEGTPAPEPRTGERDVPQAPDRRESVDLSERGYDLFDDTPPDIVNVSDGEAPKPPPSPSRPATGDGAESSGSNGDGDS